MTPELRKALQEAVEAVQGAQNQIPYAGMELARAQSKAYYFLLTHADELLSLVGERLRWVRNDRYTNAANYELWWGRQLVGEAYERNPLPGDDFEPDARWYCKLDGVHRSFPMEGNPNTIEEAKQQLWDGATAWIERTKLPASPQEENP